MRTTPEMAPELRFRLLDLSLSVRTDEPGVRDFCLSLFRRFQVEEGTPRSTLEILRTGRGGWRVRDGTLDATVSRSEWLPGILAARMLEIAGNEVRGHDLFHAAALTRRGRGLLLAGESGFGKSSLTLALLSRGWQFLSDEVGAVERNRRTLAPFPKAIEIRPDVVRLLRLGPVGPAGRGGKITCDPELLFPGGLSPGGRLEAVVLLAAAEQEAERPASEGRLDVVVHRRESGVLRALRGAEGIRHAAWGEPREGYPVLSLSFDPGRFAAWALDGLLGRHGLLVLDSTAEAPPPATFDRQPRLEPMPTAQGVAALLSRFRGRRALERRIAEEPGGFPELFLSLLRRVQGVQFFRLRVGRIRESCELLEEAVG